MRGFGPGFNRAGSESRTGWKLPHRQHVARGKFVRGDADFDAERLGGFAGLDVEFPRFRPVQVRLSSAHQFASSNENGNGDGGIGGGGIGGGTARGLVNFSITFW